MSGLTFDEATHTYTHGGVVVPGVTSILSPLTDFSRVPPHVLTAASAFGKAVHLACELDDLATLDEESLDPSLEPYLAAWRKFSAEHAVEWDQIEKPVYHATMRYAGTPDRIGLVKGVRAVVDIKSTAKLYASVGPQLSAYANAAGEPHIQRIGVQLKSDGNYVSKVFDNPSDWPVFASLLTLRTWCAQHSITPNFKA